MVNHILKNNESLIKFFIYLFFTSLLVTVLILTGASQSYSLSITQGFSDVASYVRIATTTENQSFFLLSQDIQLHHLERWPVHTIAGLLARTLGLPIWDVYKGGVFSCLFASALLVLALKCPIRNKLAYFVLIIFSPYTFRIYYGVPGMISDCIFYTCIIGFSVGIFNRAFFLISIFTILACICRQSGALLIPILVIYAYQNKISLATTITSLLSIFICLFFIKYSTHYLFQETDNRYLGRVLFGVFDWALGTPHLNELFDFIGRFGLMLATLSPLVILVKQLNQRSYFYILGFIIILIQPLLGGPIITGGNVDRLAIYGLPILGLILLTSPISTFQLIFFIALVFICSFHPHLTILRDFNLNRYIFVALVIMVTCISTLIWINKTRQAPSVKFIA
ncbi:hypothetical protein MCEZE4_00467 [Burkholderiaceae bacterium]